MKKLLFTILTLLFITTHSYAAGSDPKPKNKSDYSKAVEAIKFAKKYEKK